MITGKVLGAYGCIGTLSPTELEPTKQVIWYRRAVDEWGFDHFEVPFVAGAPMAGELADFFAETRSSLVATLMVQWAVTGPGYPEYGLASLDETARQRAFVDAASIVRELVGLQARSIGISHLAVQAGQRMGDPIAHAIAFHRSLVDLDRIVARVLPETILVAENTDTRPSDYPVATRGSKRSALDVDALVQIVGAVNRDLDPGRSVGLITEPPGLTMHEAASGATYVPLQAMYESLLRLDQDMNLLPHLAESWEQLDETTYIVKLRPGVTFHSGNPLTAEVVAQTWEQHIGEGKAGFGTDLLEPVQELVVRDELTLEIRLKRPFGPFPYILTTPHTAISDMTRFAEEGVEGLRREPSGTGPFMLERWSRGAELVLKANPNYWGGPVPIERIQFRFMPEATARSIALQTGEVDLVESVPAPEIPRLVADPEINIVDTYELRSTMWLFNLRDDVLGDPAVRKAIVHAINYDLAISSVLDEAGRPMHGYVPPAAFGYKEYRYPHDPELAESLLEEAGWSRNGDGFFEKDGQLLSWTHVSGQHLPQELEVAEAIQTLLREFGIDMRIQALDRTVHSTAMWENARIGKLPDPPKPDFGTTQWDWGIRTGDADTVLYPTFTCGGDRNFGQYCDPAFDAVIVEATSGLPAEDRIAKFAEAQEIVYQAVPAIPLYQPRITIAARKEVQNLKPTPTRMIYFHELELAR